MENREPKLTLNSSRKAAPLAKGPSGGEVQAKPTQAPRGKVLPTTTQSGAAAEKRKAAGIVEAKKIRPAANPESPQQSVEFQLEALPGADLPLAGQGEPADPFGSDAFEADAPVAVPVVGRRRKILTAIPSWLISLVVHVLLILTLAAITLEPVKSVLSILKASLSQETLEVEEFALDSPTLDDSSEAMDASAFAPDSPTFESSEVLTQIVAPEIEVATPILDALDSNRITESILPSATMNQQMIGQMSSALTSRSGAGKSQLLERYGGTAASEKSVALALKWIAEHQASDGGWNFTHTLVCGNRNCPDHGEMSEARNGATAMALLPFLGAGQTHLEGQYQQTVRRGLAFLINRMQASSAPIPMGSWWEDGGRMYSHGLAAITVCEAYAMTEDPDLAQPAQLAINYLLYAQDPKGGGWRYKPQQSGDTSVVGWCVMALKSGKMGHLVVPQSSLQKADYFLDFVSSKNGAYYGYNRPSNTPRGATDAVGLLCRMYLGWKKEHPGLQDGIRALGARGPVMRDLYYSYYATQVMRHNGGPLWEKWNRQMRDPLIALQETEGHVAGSWFTGGRHSELGGRLYSTSLATMMLEVYYRHMPLYSEKSSNDDFEL